MRAVTVAQSPATADVKSVIGRKDVTTFRPLLTFELVSVGADAPQATKLRINEAELSFKMEEHNRRLSRLEKKKLNKTAC